MDLWSKGLGRRVLNMRLEERSSMVPEQGDLVIRGTMGAPTFWDYAVRLGEHDVTEFLEFLEQPAATRFIVHAKSRWAILGAAISGALLFAVRALVALVVPPRIDASAAVVGEAELAAQEAMRKRAARDLQSVEAEVEANIQATLGEDDDEGEGARGGS